MRMSQFLCHVMFQTVEFNITLIHNTNDQLESPGNNDLSQRSQPGARISLIRIFVVKQTWKRVGLSAAYRIRSYAPSSRINSPRPSFNLIAFSPARCVRLRGKLRSFCFRASPDTFIMFPRVVRERGNGASRAKI